MAARAGFEPATKWLTATCSTAELPGIGRIAKLQGRQRNCKVPNDLAMSLSIGCPGRIRTCDKKIIPMAIGTLPLSYRAFNGLDKYREHLLNVKGRMDECR